MRIKFSNRVLVTGLLWTALLPSVGMPPAGQAAQVSARQAALDKLAQNIVKNHPHIPHMDVREVQARRGDFTLIDVREPREFAVSRIPGAINISTSGELLAFAQAHQQPLVLYCSVGRRSADLTEFLHAAGEDQAVNFAGSIFAWGNRGLALEDDLGTTAMVHPYNRFWGWRYLDAPLHATQPRDPVVGDPLPVSKPPMADIQGEIQHGEMGASAPR